MKKVSFAVLIGILVILFTSSIAYAGNVIDRSEFELGWMRMLDDQSKAYNIFGNPKDTEDKTFPGARLYYRDLKYDGLTVTLRLNYNDTSKGYIVGVDTTSTALFTKSGIRPGDPVSKLNQIYPYASPISPTVLGLPAGNYRVYEFIGRGTPWGLRFYVDNCSDIITRISMYFTAD